MVAAALLTVQVPPEMPSAKGAVAPTHTVEAPVMLPALGLTVAVTVVAVVVIAPVVVNARPLRTDPPKIRMAALLTTTVPVKLALVLRV